MTLRRVRGLWRTWSPSTAMAPCLRAAGAGDEPMTRRTPLRRSSSTECFLTAAGCVQSPLSHRSVLLHQRVLPHGLALSHRLARHRLALSHGLAPRHPALSHHPALPHHAPRSRHRARFRHRAPSHRPAKPFRPAHRPRQVESHRRARCCHPNASSARQAGPRPATRGAPAGGGRCPTRRPPVVAGHAGAVTRGNNSRAPRIGTSRHPPTPAWPRRRCSHHDSRLRRRIHLGLPHRLSSPRHPRRTRKPVPVVRRLSHP